jgi:hypothetical protein
VRLPRGWRDQVRARLNELRGPLTLREVARRTGTHPENVRRYLTTGALSLEFVAAAALALGATADWVLYGGSPSPRVRSRRTEATNFAETERALARAQAALKQARAALRGARG